MAGASSMIFCWRLCTEQSLSNKCTASPYLSPNTCNSTCLGACTNFSIKTASSSNDFFASLLHDSKDSINFVIFQPFTLNKLLEIF